MRDWLYVEDHAKALTLVVERGRIGETYNIGGRNERDQSAVVQTICDLLDRDGAVDARGRAARLISFVTDRPGHDRRYAIDAEARKRTRLARAGDLRDRTRQDRPMVSGNKTWWQAILDRGYKTNASGFRGRARRRARACSGPIELGIPERALKSEFIRIDSAFRRRSDGKGLFSRHAGTGDRKGGKRWFAARGSRILRCQCQYGGELG